jgi:rRNA maturation endonuclease Nob1
MKKEKIKHQRKEVPEITKATVQVKAKVVEIKKPTNVYSADYKLIDDTIEEIKKTCRKVCTNDYATNNVYVILQLALKKVTLAEA